MYAVIGIVFVLLLVTSAVVGDSVQTLCRIHFEQAVGHISRSDFVSASASLHMCLLEDPDSVEAAQLLGVIQFKVGNASRAAELLDRAVHLDQFRDSKIVANYVEVLRSSGNLVRATEIGYTALQIPGKLDDPQSSGLMTNLGIVEQALNHEDAALDLYLRVTRIDPTHVKAWQLCAELLIKRSPAEAETVLLKGVAVHPTDFTLQFMLGTAQHYLHKLDQALQTYLVAESLNPGDFSVKGNIASTYQGLGMVQEALRYYEAALPHAVNDAGLYNNYGALLGIMGKDHEQALWLEKALQLDPDLLPALINLAGYYQDDGELERARALVRRAAAIDKAAASREMGDYSAPLLRLRDALMLSPVTASWSQMHAERRNMTASLQMLLNEARATVASASNPRERVEVDTSLDRIHFYISYHGLNDRQLQDLVVALYHEHLKIDYYSPYVLPLSRHTFPHWVSLPQATSVEELTVRNTALPRAPTTEMQVDVPRRARIGFVSKFFGIFEPHGMLLDGVMRYLPRDRFEVIALPVARADSKPLSPAVEAACDRVKEVSLTYSHALEIIRDLRLDVLVFADTVSEPMNHFLAHARLAPIQIAFWGNPITTGSHQMDYFISSEGMEHPHRTRLPVADEPYTEQVVLMEGQGIWYLRPDIEGDLVNAQLKDKVAPARNFTRGDFGLQEGWFLYVLPQSTFKIHPLYDLVLRDILARAPQAHLVVTGGRRPRWTEIYLTRLRTALGTELSQRLHMIERVSSEQFPALLKIADVILHPFPFDGSKTSADALEVHKPIVTLPTEYLRGRMGVQFLRTMNLPELVARNRTEYVDIAVRLSADPVFYRTMVERIEESVDLIWEDMTVPYSWTRFLCGVIGVAAPTWDIFLEQSGRNVAVELTRSAVRAQNALLFDESFGPERWLLQNGVAVLETELASVEEKPCIFRDWQCSAAASSQTLSMASKGDDNRSSADGSDGAELVPHTVDADGTWVVRDEDVPVIATVRERYLDLANYGHFQEALPLAQSVYPYYAHIPLYLVELGLIHVFLGNHSEGVRLCTAAAELEPKASLIHGCIGLAGMYIPERADETIAALSTALSLKVEEEVLIRKYLAAHPGTPVNDSAAYAEVEERAGVMASAVFSLPVYALENNLLSSFRIHKRHAQCFRWCAQVNRLPGFAEGAAAILAFATVRWSPSSRPMVDQQEQVLRQRGEFSLPENVTLWDEIIRVQRRSQHMLTVALECLQGLREDPVHPNYLNNLLGDIMRIMIQREEQADVFVAERVRAGAAEGTVPSAVQGHPLSMPSNQPGVVLLLQYYLPAEAVKASDINSALWRNLQNDHITDIYLLNEREVDFSAFPNSHKIHQIVIGERLSFQRAFAFANQHLVGRTVVLANADIFFDSSLRHLSAIEGSRTPSLQANRQVLALLKWVYNAQSGTMSLNVRTDSQDAWVFQPPLDAAALEELNFYMGLPKCDNRLVYVLQQHNYTLLDPAFAVHALELDSVVRTQVLYNIEQTVVGSTSTLLLSDLFEF